MNKPVIIVSAIVIVLLVAGGAFLGGMSLGKAQATNVQNDFFASRGIDPNNLPAGGAQGFNGAPPAGGFQGGANGQGAQGNIRGQGQRGAFGTVTKVDGNTLTMTDQQGKEVTVTLSNDTTIMKTVKGDQSDLKAGDRIVVQGERSGDNVAATGIQIPDQSATGAGGFFGGPGTRGDAPSPTPAK